MKQHIHSLLAIVFIVSTLFTSLHELMPHHASSDCQVCTLVQQDSGAIVDNIPAFTTLYLEFETTVFTYQLSSTFHHNYLLARAPPSSS